MLFRYSMPSIPGCQTTDYRYGTGEPTGGRLMEKPKMHTVRQTASHPYASGGTARRAAIARRRGAEQGQNSFEYSFPALRAFDVKVTIGYTAA